MSKLNLPPDIAKQRQMQAAAANQVYTLASQIYSRLLAAMVYDEHPPLDVAKMSIECAKAFTQAIKEDLNVEATEPSPSSAEGTE